MNKKLLDILTVVIPAAVIIIFTVAFVITPEKNYSEGERRVLAKAPAFSLETLTNGRFMTGYEDYALDQFVGRETFRSMKARISRDVLRQKDNNGMYMADGYISKLNYPLDESRLNRSLQTQRKVYDTYIKTSSCRVYQCVIPDKNYYLAESSGRLAMDYNKYEEMVKAGADYASHVDISNAISLESFYKTDQHIRQEAMLPVAKALIEAMNDGATFDETRFSEETLDVDFYGAYYRQAALSAKPDTIRYLTFDGLADAVVTSFDKGKPEKAYVYDMKKAHGRDPYEMFMSGSCALMTMETPGAKSSRELVMFRDSFGSALAPLLAPYYRKITLVDLRYIKAETLGEYVDFHNQDVLFAYSTLIY